MRRVVAVFFHFYNDNKCTRLDPRKTLGPHKIYDTGDSPHSVDELLPMSVAIITIVKLFYGIINANWLKSSTLC